jgi:uncharacterized protein with FMN-binding domain
MRRPAIVMVATAAGLALVMGYRPHAQALSGTGRAASTGDASGTAAAGTVTAVGSDEPLQDGLGDIQVKVSAASGRIVGVGMARLNVQGPQSAQITNDVLPQLEQQTMAAQSAAIQGVSGATYTTQAYVASLQAALDKIASTGGANAALGAGDGNGGLVPGQGGAFGD